MVSARNFRRGVALTAFLFFLISESEISQAETTPGHLAQLTKQIVERSADGLKAAKLAADPAHVKTIEAGLAAVKKARVSSWSSKAIDVGQPYRQVAALLGLDPKNSKTYDVIQSLTKLVGEPLSEKIQDELGNSAPPEKVDEVAKAVEALRSGGGGETHHDVDLGEGERLEIDWSPETAEVVITALKEAGQPDDYELSLQGMTEISRDPETGEPVIEAQAYKSKPPRALTAREIEDRKASILGTWENDKYVWQISAASEDAGYVRRPDREIRKEIDALRQEIEALQRAVEYIWVEANTGEILRQEKFRRLSEPWVYKGEKSLVPDVEKEIAQKEKKIDDLEGEARGEDRPLSERLDPVAFERVKASPISRSLRIKVRTKAEECTYSFAEAYFNGRIVVGRRSHSDICTMNKSLPIQIKSELIASWSPPAWLLLRAIYNDSGELSLGGSYWGMRVAYDPDAMTVSRIFEPYASEQVEFRDGGGKTFVALGAADSLWP